MMTNQSVGLSLLDHALNAMLMLSYVALRQNAVQALIGSVGYARTLVEQTCTGQLAYTPGVKLRAVGTLEFMRSRPEGATEYTRTLQSGPDLSYAVVQGLKNGDQLSILGQYQNCTWLQVSLQNGATGWVYEGW